MNKVITNFTVLFFLIFASQSVLLAQTFCLQMTEVSNDGTDLVVLVEMQSDGTLNLADANFQFAYDIGSLGTPSLASSPLAPPIYFTPTITSPASGIASINIVLPFPGTGTSIAIAPGWTELVQITFPIIDGSAIGEFSWEYNGGTTQSVAYADHPTVPFQIFATSNGCLAGYTPVPVPAAPLCPILDSPVDLAIDVASITGVQFDWTNNPVGTPATSINFFFGTDPLALTDMGDIGVVETYTELSTAFSTTYYYSVVPSNSSGVATGCDVFSFTTQDPPLGGTNFSCANAIPIGDGVYTDLGPLEGEGATNSCFAFSTNASWYVYTAPAAGECTISSSIDLDEPDTRISVHSACDTTDCIAFDDDGGIGFTSIVTFDVVAGEDYYIEWDDRWDDGEFDFEVSCTLDISGCTDPLGCNYDPLATIEDGSCFYLTSCDDGDACTTDSEDQCDPLDCVNTPVDCDDNNACTLDSCNPISGCVNTPIICNDSDPCTTNSCDPAVGCVYTPINCDDGDACTTDSCELGVCVNTIVDCDDNDACTIDSCDPLTGCVNLLNDCDDGNECTTDSCDPVTGCINTAIDCDDGDACTTDSCDPATGCINTSINCDDGNACTTDSCDPVTGCVNTLIDCDDGDACTADSCDPATGCINNAIDCDDGDACTADSCDPATGCVNTAINCDDGNACTTDTCDPAIGCVNTVIDCDDGDACTTDTCDPATGCVNTPIDCDDSDACTTDSCDPVTGCVNTAIDCNDGDACTTDSCDPATGCVNTIIDCDDGDPATTDSCDPLTGCVNTPIVACPTDFNLDGTTNGDDFSIFLGNFGLNCTGCPTDLDNDGITNGDDFSIFLGNFGLDCL